MTTFVFKVAYLVRIWVSLQGVCYPFVRASKCNSVSNNLQPTVKYFRWEFFRNCGAPGDGMFWQLPLWLSSSSEAVARANKRGRTAFMVIREQTGSVRKDQKSSLDILELLLYILQL
jgi:hypothetical protein